jgi:uncharacterized membrane protein YoaK (UPF0700 family)
MTGTLVKPGQRIAAALLVGDRFAWVRYLLLWSGRVFGAAVGALIIHHIGLNGLWLGVGAAMLLAVLASCLDSGRH